MGDARFARSVRFAQLVDARFARFVDYYDRSYCDLNLGFEDFLVLNLHKSFHQILKIF